MNAFLTGSRVYGKPREDSDIDLVVQLNESEMFKLEMLAEGKQSFTEYGEGVSLKFGRLNLIVLNSDAMVARWLLSTRECQAKKPVSKEDAAKHFQEREEALLEAVS